MKHTIVQTGTENHNAWNELTVGILEDNTVWITISRREQDGSLTHDNNTLIEVELDELKKLVTVLEVEMNLQKETV